MTDPVEEDEIQTTPKEEEPEMAKTHFDDEDDFEKIRPGTIDVDDLFDSDKPFEENDVEVEQVTENAEDYSDYMFDSNDEPVNTSDSEDDYGEDEYDVEDENFEDRLVDDTYEDESIIRESLEETETTVEEQSTEDRGDFDGDTIVIEQIEDESDAIEEEETTETVEEETEEVDVEVEETEEDILNDMLDDVTASKESDEVVDDDDETSSDSEDILDVGFEEVDEEIDNPDTEPVDVETPIRQVTVEEVEDGTKITVEEPTEDVSKRIEESRKKLEEEVNIDKIDKVIEQVEPTEEPKLSPEEASYFKTEADGSLADYMKKKFKMKVQEIQNAYTEIQLINYLEGFSSKEDRDLIREQYCYEYTNYHKYVDFTNPAAKAALWILVAGEFANMVEMKKFNGEIQPVLVSDKNIYDGDPNNIEDENSVARKEHRRKEFLESSKYTIDRTVWEIDDEIAEENTSIFDENKDLFSEFKKSEFYGILSQVMESNRIVDMSKVQSKVIIKESCGYYPIIDFNTGIRVICIDTEDSSQYNSHPLLFNRKVPFSFKVPKSGIKTRIIYSDICRECPIATVFALKKLIAYDYFKDRYKINIANNYVISYTTEQTYLDMFEKGDPDSKRPGSSTYYAPKPATNFLGIVVLDKKTEKDIKSVHRNQVYRDLNRAPDVSVDNYDPQFILSARYIRNDLRLRNPTIPVNQRFVEYTITQYTECNSVIINDGIQVICACLIKEHHANYAPGTPYSISFEFDRDNLLTPAVVRMLDAHDGFEPSMIKKAAPLECMQTFILPPSRKKLDGVLPSEKGRLDVRYFSPQSIQSRYRDQRDLWSRYDLTTQQGRNEFIKSRGFEVFMSPKYMTFDIMPDCLMNIENGNVIRNIQKISITSLADRNSDDTISLLNKQKEMEYYQSLDNSEMGAFQKFLINATNIMLDYLDKQNV